MRTLFLLLVIGIMTAWIWTTPEMKPPSDERFRQHAEAAPSTNSMGIASIITRHE